MPQVHPVVPPDGLGHRGVDEGVQAVKASVMDTISLTSASEALLCLGANLQQGMYPSIAAHVSIFLTCIACVSASRFAVPYQIG